jgi:hypothetical protein
MAVVLASSSDDSSELSAFLNFLFFPVRTLETLLSPASRK